MAFSRQPQILPREKRLPFANLQQAKGGGEGQLAIHLLDFTGNSYIRATHH
jgi:hypothetical protein